MAFIDIRQFSYTYPGEEVPVLTNLDLSLEQGSFTVITGKSGSGKSTLGKALAGFLFQDDVAQYSGKVTINNTDMTQLPLFVSSQRAAYVQQNPEDQFCTLTVLDEIAFGLENLGTASDEIDRRIADALEVVQGRNLIGRKLANLSGGEKQKVAIASMLALSPDVLILDEPTSNLDPIATLNIFDTLNQMRASQSLTVVIIEHKIDQLRALKPDFYLLEEGKIKPYQESSIPLATPAGKTTLPIGEKSVAGHANLPIVDMSEVDVILNDHPVLKNISLSLFSGELIALSGPNGSGKTTLIQTIMGFHSPAKGSLSVFDQQNPKIKTSELVRNIGFIFQNPDHQLFTQSVWQEAIFTAEKLRFPKGEREEKAENWLKLMGILDKREHHPQRLSYGQKRRLNLIAIILHEPRLLMIDEFMIGQDTENAHLWMTILRDYAKLGNTVLLVNHHADLTRQYCDRLVFLDQGSIQVDAPIPNAFARLAQINYSAFLPTGGSIADHA